MAKKAEKMIVAGGVRYKQSVAERLGLIADGKVVTARSRQVGVTTTSHVAKAQADAAAAAKAQADAAAVAEAAAAAAGARPAGNASLEVWVAYAIAQGKSADELAGLKRKDIVALLDTAPVPTPGGDDQSDDSSDDEDSDDESDNQ